MSDNEELQFSEHPCDLDQRESDRCIGPTFTFAAGPDRPHGLILSGFFAGAVSVSGPKGLSGLLP